MLFKKTKDNFIYIVLSFFLIGNMFLINQAFYLKKLLIISFLVITVSACFFQKGKLEGIIRYFIYFNNDKIVKKISGIMSLLSLLFFILSLFSLNMGLIWFARWFILIFIINVAVSGILVFFDLERSGHIVFNKMKFVFGSAVSLLYLITSAYAASYFMQFSNMDVSDSPLLEFGWKLAFFTIYFFMILQPVSYFVFLSISNKLIGHQLITFFGILMVTSLLLFAVPRWAENFIVLVLDWATSSEWHNSAMCGSLRISDSTERYFGFNTDKYTVYFSNRDGKWGFEELQCAKDDKNQDSFTRVLVEQSNMPQWFKE
ncbi:hypothetical protein ACLED8_12620 [Lonsdalea quercina]|uniref:Uncharacterized protein n=2 Tax=Lonsdalea quercina TaxID=71657 RepID=A0A1H4E0L5_9GAMM|nr:hypothetical protein [Lonsdalea quercina]SEA78594.1 hypothetical protein SAMN02982996_02503 [Lonsdalea quercina]